MRRIAIAGRTEPPLVCDGPSQREPALGAPPPDLPPIHMRRFAFETVDVFTDRRFGGNPLAVIPDARGLSDDEMQSLAAEFNLSETAFVLPPADPANTARVRIFHRTAELPFAGHPSVGTAYVLAQRTHADSDCLTFEQQAGLVEVRLMRDADGVIAGAIISAPQALSLGLEVSAAEIAECAGLTPDDIVLSAHRPVLASMGNSYIVAEVTGSALTRARPDLAAFQRASERRPTLKGRFSLHLYARTPGPIRARMFAPLAGTWEDPATGSANAPLAGLLLSLSGENRCRLQIVQGVELGRPSTLHVTAQRRDGGIYASVGGHCVSVMRGEVTMDP